MDKNHTKKNRVSLLKITQKLHMFIYPLCHYFHADRTRYSYSAPYCDAIYEKKSRSTQNGHENLEFTILYVYFNLKVCLLKMDYYTNLKI